MYRPTDGDSPDNAPKGRIDDQENDVEREVEGVPVLGCWPGSSAHRAGVRADDTVMRVNGLPVDNIRDYFNARKLNEDGMDIVVKRDWQLLEFTFRFDRPINEKAAMKMVEGLMGGEEQEDENLFQ